MRASAARAGADARVERWLRQGEIVEVLGRRLYVQKRDGEGPLLILFHGFPSSSYDWRRLAELLPGHRILMLDFLGFGLSEKPRDVVYTLGWQADAVEELVRRAGSPPVFVVAHDMGTSVATELLARDLSGALPFEVQRAVLTNGSVILERASLRPSQKILRGPLGPLFSRLTNERGFMRGFARLFSAAHPLSKEEAQAQWALLARDDGQRILHLLCAYLDERVRFAQRWHGAVRDWDKPLSFLWATGDPVATTEVLAGLIELRPTAEVIRLAGIGHYPQIEVPDEFTAGALTLLQLD
jgi:pimeloyl-ACP methyl ester carboxylesterase